MDRLDRMVILAGQIIKESPFYKDYYGGMPCFFCDEQQPSHADGCAWMALRNLFGIGNVAQELMRQENENDEIEKDTTNPIS